MGISIVVPVHESRIKDLEKCLDSVEKAQKSIAEESEIIVVTDNIKNSNTLDNLIQSYPSVRFVRNSGHGPSAARNFGIGNTVHDIIAFTDSDCVVDYNWPKAISEYFKEHPDSIAVQGIPWLYQNPGKRFAKYSSKFYEAIFTARYVREDRSINIDTRNFAVRKKVLEDLEKPLFPNNNPLAAGEDRYAGALLNGIGFIGWEQKMIVQHKNLNPFSTLLQHFRHGRGRKYYRGSLKDVSVFDTYFVKPVKMGVPFWYVFASNLFFGLGWLYEQIKYPIKVGLSTKYASI